MTRNHAGLDNCLKVFRSFYLYGGHIELIRFNEYYGIPRGHEHDLLYSLSIKNMVLYCIFLGKKAIYRNIPKLSLKAYIFQRSLPSGLCVLHHFVFSQHLFDFMGLATANSITMAKQLYGCNLLSY